MNFKILRSSIFSFVPFAPLGNVSAPPERLLGYIVARCLQDKKMIIYP